MFLQVPGVDIPVPLPGNPNITDQPWFPTAAGAGVAALGLMLFWGVLKKHPVLLGGLSIVLGIVVAIYFSLS